MSIQYSQYNTIQYYEILNCEYFTFSAYIFMLLVIVAWRGGGGGGAAGLGTNAWSEREKRFTKPIKLENDIHGVRFSLNVSRQKSYSQF